jgi:hypothetical protein
MDCCDVVDVGVRVGVVLRWSWGVDDDALVFWRP